MVALQTASAGKEGGVEKCQRALTREQTLWGGGALERGHGAPLEPLAQLGDAFCSVSPPTEWVDATETVAVQAAQAKERRNVNGR